MNISQSVLKLTFHCVIVYDKHYNYLNQYDDDDDDDKFNQFTV